MMVIVPAMFLALDLFIFPNHRWDILHAVAVHERVACLLVPALVSAANASIIEPINMENSALIFTAGYLSRSRSELICSKFRGVTLLSSYGASETGVMTLDREPGVGKHVGRPLAGKPVWIVDPDANGVGKIATTGPDCREIYWGQPGRIRDEHGVVASVDFGHFDQNGNLYLDGRVDGAEKLHGLTIYPGQIERHILMLQGVEDVRVRLNAEGGLERLEVSVVGSVSPDAVREHCRSLPDVCRPALVRCITEATGNYSSRGKL